MSDNPHVGSAAHIKLVYPPGTERGVKRTSRGAQVFVDLGEGLKSFPAVKQVDLHPHIDDADLVQLSIVATMEIVYAEDEA